MPPPAVQPTRFDDGVDVNGNGSETWSLRLAKATPPVPYSNARPDAHPRRPRTVLSISKLDVKMVWFKVEMLGTAVLCLSDDHETSASTPSTICDICQL